jgi:hypothetical protein
MQVVKAKDEVVNDGRLQPDAPVELPAGTFRTSIGTCPATFPYRHHDEGGPPASQLAVSPQSRLGTPNPGPVHSHFPMQRLSGHVDHGLPQLVQRHPCRLITSQTQLAPQEKRRDAPFIRGHEVSCPEPDGQQGFGIMQNRSRREGDLTPTASALPAPRFHNLI